MADKIILVGDKKITRVLDEYDQNLIPPSDTVVTQNLSSQMFTTITEGIEIGEDTLVAMMLMGIGDEIAAAEGVMAFTGDNQVIYGVNAEVTLTIEELELLEAQAQAAADEAAQAAADAAAAAALIPVLHEATYVLGGNNTCFYPIWFISDFEELNTLIITNDDLYCELEAYGGNDDALNTRVVNIVSITQASENKMLVLPGVNMYCALASDPNTYGYLCDKRHGIYLRGGASYTFISYYKNLIDELAAAFSVGTIDSFVDPQDTSNTPETFNLTINSVTYIAKKLTEIQVTEITADPRVLGESI